MSKKHPTSPDRHAPKVSDDDKFVAGVLEASTWAKRNQQKVVIAGIALAVAAIAAWGVASSRANMMDDALVELERVTGTAQVGDPEQAKVELTQFLDQFGGTPLAGEARLHLATLYLETNQPGQALSTLNESGIGARDILGPQVLTLKARAYEAQGEWQRAADTYIELSDAAELEFQRRSAMEDAARVMAEMGQYAAAAELYAELQSGLERSDPQLGIYQMREQEMRGMARG